MAAFGSLFSASFVGLSARFANLFAVRIAGRRGSASDGSERSRRNAMIDSRGTWELSLGSLTRTVLVELGRTGCGRCFAFL